MCSVAIGCEIVMCPLAKSTVLETGAATTEVIFSPLGSVTESEAATEAAAWRNSSTKISAVAGRLLRSFCSAWRATASIAAGICTPCEAIGAGSAFKCFCIMDGIPLPLNGTLPVNIW